MCVLLVAFGSQAQEMPKKQAPVWASNPDISAFGAIETAHLTAAQNALRVSPVYRCSGVAERCVWMDLLHDSFGHLAGYSSSYYTYVWDKVIAEDFFQQFDHENLLSGPTPMRYRHVVLEPGGSASAKDLVKNFLGHPQRMDAYEEWASQEFKEHP